MHSFRNFIITNWNRCFACYSRAAKRRFLFDEVRFEREDLRKSMFFASNGRVVESCCSYFYWLIDVRTGPQKVESGRKVGIFHSKSLSRINPIGFLFLSLVMRFRNLESWDSKKLESGSQTHQQTQLTEISQFSRNLTEIYQALSNQRMLMWDSNP